jgi:hypothetical protein
MILAHDIIARTGLDPDLELLGVIDGDAFLQADLRLAVEHAAELLEHESEEEADATHELRGMLRSALGELRA